MLSRFFSNSKPIVLTSLLLVSSIWFWVFVFWNPTQQAFPSVGVLLFNWLLVLLIFFIADFINKKSRINKLNSFALVSLVALILSTPEVFFEQTILVASLFLILAIRRIINLQNPTNTKKKIFEASIWLFYASLYEPWLSLGYFVLYFSILYFVPKNIRNYVIPLFGILAGYTLKQLYHVIRFDQWYLFPQDYFEASWELSNWLNKPQVYVTVLYFLLGIWAATHAIKILNKAKINQKTNLSVLFVLSFIGLLNASLSSNTIEKELLFCFIPFSFLLGSYFQLKQKRWTKEIAFGLLVFLPIIKLILFLVMDNTIYQLKLPQ